MADRPRILFVTGKLAEPSLRRVLSELLPSAEFEAEIAVMPITVAALLTTDWIARHWQPHENIDRVILPGLCRGDLDAVSQAANAPVQRGPNDLRELPEFFGKRAAPPRDYGKYDIEIIAEINHAPVKSWEEIRRIAHHYRNSGAEVIDLGCDPGGNWSGVGEATRMLREEGFRVSVDSFNPVEVEAALGAGAELVLSVNSSNLASVPRWLEHFADFEVVAIPDTPNDTASLDRTVDRLREWGVRFRLDPIIEPIGFGFTESLIRYHSTRYRYPDAAMMMGIGNLTELTDVDSAGVNVLLAAICQELRIQSVLATEVINWSRSAVREFDLARRLVYHSVTNRVLPKHLEPNLIVLRDRKIFENGPEALEELASRVTDKNYRIFAEGGEVHAVNGSGYRHNADVFALFAEIQAHDSKLTPSHAFYLGYEMAKAVTALTLGKQYTQDEALNWGFLTQPETSHRGGK